eukprot:gnl/Ergobibamus_cyprinoides/3590.p1 GENE.gnl/Ergobibamus_cyprinoides/3590~~gnl/Ergobibamus_cyprinoides/3590.p1  ORF type:complete len:274 (+),score=38.19 gnl/Ergobibamus_cyprinoides/3590:110-931(+)
MDGTDSSPRPRRPSSSPSVAEAKDLVAQAEYAAATLSQAVGASATLATSSLQRREAIAAYAAQLSVVQSRRSELDEAIASAETLADELASLREERLSKFMSGYDLINSRLQETYRMLTVAGGSAQLSLVDAGGDPFAEGIAFDVSPPYKGWRPVQNLSGGEKTLASLALTFAIHAFAPNAVYVLDEIDAALDRHNVGIVAAYVRRRTQRLSAEQAGTAADVPGAQFIVVSLRDEMYGCNLLGTDRLIGIAKIDNCTRSFVLDPAREVDRLNSE